MIEYRVTKDIADAQLRELYDSQGWTSYTNSTDDLSTLLTNCYLVYSAWDGDNLVGLIRTISDGVSICYIQDILVRPRYQGLGIGKKLLSFVLNSAKEIRQLFLTTDAADTYVTDWYQRQGFEPNETLGMVGYALPLAASGPPRCSAATRR